MTGCPGPRVGRLVHSSDFKRLLAAPAWSRSAHFAVHHSPGGPGGAVAPADGPVGEDLSTGAVHNDDGSVDDSGATHWIGVVLPKRLARRAVTRNLLRRQIKAAIGRHAGALPGGLWVVRLRAGFDRAEFRSAASDPLRRAARAELDMAFAGH